MSTKYQRRRGEWPMWCRPVEVGLNATTCARLGLLVFQVAHVVRSEDVPPMLVPFLAVSGRTGAATHVAFDVNGFGSCTATGDLSYGVHLMGPDEVPEVDAVTLRTSTVRPTAELRRWYFETVRPGLRGRPLKPMGETVDVSTLAGRFRLELASRAVRPLGPYIGEDRTVTRLAFELAHRGVGLSADVAARHVCAWFEGVHADFASPEALMSAVRDAGYSESTAWVGFGELVREPTQAELAEVASLVPVDPWRSVLGMWLADRDEVTSPEISEYLRDVGELRAAPIPATLTRIHGCMVRLGFAKKQIQRGGRRFTTFMRVPTSEAP